MWNQLNTVLLLHAVATLFMVGLIWFVQIVHYPMFADLGSELFAAYEKRHSKMTTFVVGPPMLLELATVMALLKLAPQGTMSGLAWAGAACLGLIWFSTAFLQVPMHAKLESGFDPDAHSFLVNTNWIRTILWTLRGGIAVLMLSLQLPGK